MNTQLDHFETALLGELRAHVTTRAAEQRRRSPRRRWAAGLAAAVAGGAVVVTGLGGAVGTAPAYAVEQGSGGELVVTIHRLEDADGLETALRDRGIEADVSYASTLVVDLRDTPGELPPPPSADGPDLADSQVTQGTSADGCGGAGVEPASLSRTGEDWELRIPAESPLRDREMTIQTTSTGDLAVTYPGTEPGSSCAVVAARG